MASTYEIRDPIHGAIVIDEHERQVVDHPWFQRLRHIRQLGFVSVVYPGGVHDRFQHSLGVLHLAGLMFDRALAQSPRFQAQLADTDRIYARRVLRLAGLLHDAGHAPFSHTSEAYLPAQVALALPQTWYGEGFAPSPAVSATHEHCTLAFIAGLVSEGRLDEEEARDIAAVLSPDIRPGRRLAALGPVRGILQALISGEVDADRSDYLLRDSHFTGVDYGVYDLTRLLACLRILDGPGGPELGLDVHGVHPLEGLLLARYHMFLQVYFHKTPPAFEYYLAQAVAAGEVHLDFSAGLSDLVRQRDDTVYSQLFAAHSAGAEWSRRIIEREPASLILRVRMGAERQENFLAHGLVMALEQAGCHVFTRRSRQVFTTLDGAGMQAGRRLLCERRVLGRPVVEAVSQHSDLLAQFNSPIDIQHTYVLRRDVERARSIVEEYPVC